MAKKPKKAKPFQPPKPGNGDKGKPIANYNGFRDPNSGAVINNDTAGYQRAIKRKRAGKRIEQQEMKMREQEKRIASMEEKLDQILARLPQQP
jgi:hypothetical protein